MLDHNSPCVEHDLKVGDRVWARLPRVFSDIKIARHLDQYDRGTVTAVAEPPTGWMWKNVYKVYFDNGFVGSMLTARDIEPIPVLERLAEIHRSSVWDTQG